MKACLIRLSVACGFLLAISCGDDDSDDVGTAGAGDRGGAETGGTAGDHGGAETGGSAGDRGGAETELEAGGGGAPPESPMCEPPSPPEVGEGGASGAAGANGAAGASGAAGGETSASALAIVGEYEDDFGGQQIVTSSSWMSGASIFHISAFDNQEHWILARNDQANAYNPCLWSRFDWTFADSKLYYCQSAYDAVDEAAAAEADAPDPSHPDETGCSGFPWSELTPK